MLKKSFLVAMIVVSLVGVANADGFSWVFQDTGSMVSADVALALRGGYTWPVVFSGGPTMAMLPTGWRNVGDMLVGSMPEAASSPTGEVAAWYDGSAKVSGPMGWESLAADALAFDGQGRLWRAIDDQVSYRDGGAWHYLPSMATGVLDISIAVAGSGEVGAVVYEGGALYYHHYSLLTGGWTRSENLNVLGIPLQQNPALAFDSHDIPHIVGTAGGSGGVAFDFDIRTGQWVNSQLPQALSAVGVLSIASDGSGTVGTAYVSGGELYYALNVDNGGWIAVALPTGGGPPPTLGPTPDPRGVGLAYDYNGTPIIAYSGGGSMWLAYDPPDAPEPLTLTLLVAGGLAVLRKRR